MEFFKKINVNKKIYLLPILALISFSTWFFNVKEVYNIIIYMMLFVGLVLLKATNLTLVMFMLFTAPANRNASFLTGDVAVYTFLYQAIFIAFALYIIGKSIYKKQAVRGKLLLPMILLVVYALIAILWTPDKSFGFSEIGVIIQGYIVYFAIKSDQDSKVDFYEISWFFTLLLLVISLEYLVLTYKFIDFNNFPFPHKDPLFGLWANPNIVAAFFSIGFIPSLYKYFAKDKSKYRFLYLPLELLIIYAIIASKSVGLYFAIIIGVIFICIQFYIKNKKLLIYMILGLMLSFVLIMLTIVLLKGSYPDFFDKLNKFSSSRLRIYEIGFKSIANPMKLIFGNGTGSSKPILLANGFSNIYMHSWIINLTVQRGLISLGVTMYLLYSSFKIVYSSNSKYKYFMAAGIVVYLAHALIDISFDYQYIGVMLYMGIALFENYNNDFIKELM